ncbi:MAG: STAS domain-containing protein [Actinomycetota bacterium]|nr:STAS domain-containing protein [Actinomycetota bacterium]
MTANLTVMTSEDAGALRVAAKGDLDLATVDRLGHALEDAERRASGSSVVLDLSGLAFMDSTGLQILLDADVRAATAGHALAVVPGDGEARRVLEIAGALSLLSVTEVRPG